MYFVLYDRFLNSIGDTYILESWQRTQRAVDFDDLKIVGEQIPYSAEPFIVAINDRQGHLQFSGLASTPTIDDKTKKTSLSLKDYTTLFNTEIIVDWSKFSGTTLDKYFDFIFGCWKEQTDVGFSTILWDVTRLSNILLDPEIPLGDGKESVLLNDLVRDAILYYDLYCLPSLNIFGKTLTFIFHQANINHASVRLKDFGINTVEKSFGEYNRATVYDSEYNLNQTWSLTEDNSVVKLPSEKNLVYPAKNRNFIAQESDTNSLNDALYDAVMGLAENRYQENIDLNAQLNTSMLDLSSLDFSYSVEVYTEDGYYRKLPVGEIETDSKGKHIVRLGYRVQELTQEL